MILDFDPTRAAHFEVEAWKAHHVGKHARLLRMVIAMHHEVFGLGRVKALIACRPLVSAIRAHNRVDKVTAQRELELYYFLLKRFNRYTYSESAVAAKEAAWWWLHDDLEHVADKAPSLTHLRSCARCFWACRLRA